ncbi:MAG: GntR family transcriptional regulator [Planctomycetota bacterium]|nr:GntR family transcriptional regulator [Planctomycetota bacterium]
MATPTLKRPGKRERVRAYLEAQLATGRLSPGDRLVSVRVLARQFRTAPREVLAALHELAESGALEGRARSGFFVRVGRGKPEAGGPSSGGYEVDRAALDRPRRAATLRVYVADAYPPQVEAWRRAVAGFEARQARVRVELVTGQAGHVQDLHAESPFDVAVAGSAVLGALGAERFLTAAELKRQGVGVDDPLPEVAHWTAHAEPAVGAAVLANLRWVYVNSELLSRAGLAADAPRDWEALYARAEAAEAAPDGAPLGYSPGSLFDELTRAGALRAGACGRMELDAARAGAYLQWRAKRPLRGDRRWAPDFALPEFRAGRLLAFPMGSYLALALPHTVSFPWTVWPLALGADGCDELRLMSVGVRRDGPHPGEALELARAFCTPEVQRAMAALHGNLPVSRAAFEESYAPGHPAPEAYLRAGLAGATARVGDTPAKVALQERVAALHAPFLRGLRGAGDALADLERLVRACREADAKRGGARAANGEPGA